MKQPLLLGLVLTTIFAACSKDAPIDATPFTATLNRKTHKDWYDYVRPNMQELGWTLWEWSPQLAPAARMASASNKPLLLWLERGHPLGNTSAEGMQRRALWVDVNLNLSLTRFQFAADDLNMLLPAKDAEGKLAAALLEQVGDGGSDIRDHGGVLLASAGGVLLGSFSGQYATAFKQELVNALSKWDTLPREQRRLENMLEMVSENRLANDFPDDGLALEVHRRVLSSDLSLSAPRSENYTHDYLWLSAEEMALMLPTRMGQSVEVPEALAQRFALFTLVDDLKGHGEVFSVADLQQADLTFKGISNAGGTVRFTISGEFAATASDQRGMHGVLEGMGSVNLAQQRIASLNFVAQVQSWGPEVERMADGSWPVLGMAIHRVESFEGSHRIAPTQISQ
jgi:hypothetical protein